MPIATTAILAATAVAGLGVSAYGLQQQMAAKDQMAGAAQGQSIGAKIQAAGAQQQAEGAQTQVQGAIAQNAATKAITGLEFQGEEQRQKAMELDARRQSLQTIRQAQVARAQGLTIANAQGARQGSGLQGAYGQISGDANTSLLGVGQNLAIGRAIFGINSDISQQKLAYAAGGDIINQGAGQIAAGQGLIAQGGGVIAQYGGQMAAAQGQLAFGQSLGSLGGQLVQMAPTIANVGSTIGTGFGNMFNYSSMGNTYGGSMKLMGSNGLY